MSLKRYPALNMVFQSAHRAYQLFYESYWQGASHNFIECIPGFREVMDLDRFIAIWGFLHLVDQTDEAVDKSDKIYKVRLMLDRMFPLFRRYYSHHQQQEPPCHQAVHMRQAGQMGHQELPAVRG